MQVTEKIENGVLVIRPQESRLDAHSAPDFKNSIVDASFSGYTAVAIDLDQVVYMDSSGLSALLSSLKSLGKNGRIALFNVQERVRKLFDITRLDKHVFRIFPSKEEAVRSLH